MANTTMLGNHLFGDLGTPELDPFLRRPQAAPQRPAVTQAGMMQPMRFAPADASPVAVEQPVLPNDYANTYQQPVMRPDAVPQYQYAGEPAVPMPEGGGMSYLPQPDLSLPMSPLPPPMSMLPPGALARPPMAAPMAPPLAPPLAPPMPTPRPAPLATAATPMLANTGFDFGGAILRGFGVLG